MDSKKLIKAFVEDRLNYRNLIHSAAEGVIITDSEGNILLINPRIEEMFGYQQSELVGKKIEVLIPQRFRKLHTLHRSHYMESPSRRVMGVGRELVGLRKDGTEFFIEASLSPINTDEGVFVLGFIIDITKRKLAEKELEQERQRIQQYLNIAGVILMVLNNDGTIQMLNKRGYQTLGYEEDELLGKDWFETCIPEEIRKDLRALFDDIIAKGSCDPLPHENEILTRDGKRRTISWVNVVLKDEEGRVTGVLSSGEDITEQKRAEEQARLHQQQLAQADKMATLGILVSGVAHEINNPTSFIMLNGKIFAKVWEDITPILDEYYQSNGDFMIAGMPYSRANEKIPRLIDGVTEGAKRIERIIRSLKDFARQDSGDLNESVNLNEVIEAAILIVHNLIKKSTDHFEFLPDPQLPPVLGNSQQLEQVVINLITNACQALTDPSQALFVRTRYLPEQQIVEIEVEDHGIGISEENLKHITDPFFTTKQSAGGTGLGLSICYNIVKSHGGLLNFKSKLNQGTKVVVSLPINHQKMSLSKV
jgi:PAS domain S-box-containing protein